MSYEIDDIQYLATMVSGNRALDLGGSLLVFRLGGKAMMPVRMKASLPIPKQPEVTASTDNYLNGERLYSAQCANCHGGIGVPSEISIAAPDLRRMTLDTHNEFLNIVLKGSLGEQGMAGFAEALSVAEAEAIQHFLIVEANALRVSQQQLKPARNDADDEVDKPIIKGEASNG